jgi:hypothetical protein
LRYSYYPQLGDVKITSPTTERLRSWLAELADAKPRARTKAGQQQNYRAFIEDQEYRRPARATRTCKRDPLNVSAAFARTKSVAAVSKNVRAYAYIPPVARLLRCAMPDDWPDWAFTTLIVAIAVTVIVLVTAVLVMWP